MFLLEVNIVIGDVGLLFFVMLILYLFLLNFGGLLLIFFKVIEIWKIILKNFFMKYYLILWKNI